KSKGDTSGKGEHGREGNLSQAVEATGSLRSDSMALATAVGSDHAPSIAKAHDRQTILDGFSLPRRTRPMGMILHPSLLLPRFKCRASRDQSFVLIRPFENIRLNEQLTPWNQNP